MKRGTAPSALTVTELQAFSRRRYTARELAGVIPKETVMASSLWAEAVSKAAGKGSLPAPRPVGPSRTEGGHSDE